MIKVLLKILQKVEMYKPNQELLERYFLNTVTNRNAAWKERSCFADCVESPSGLAEWTCTKIGETLDKKEQNSNNIISKPPAVLNFSEKTIDSEEFKRFEVSKSTGMSDTFLNSAFYSPETFLPYSFLLQTSEEMLPEKKIKKEQDDSEQKKNDEIAPPRQSSRWIGLIASISFGMLLALFLFLMIRLAMRSTQSYIADSWTSEINRRVGQYEQIYASAGIKSQVKEMKPFNWDLSDWQELHWDNRILQDVFLEQNLFQSYSFQSFADEFTDIFERIAGERKDDGANKMMNTGIIDAGIMDAEGSEYPSPAEKNRFQDSVLLVLPGRESVVRSAFGQSSMLKGSRVFLRSLPQAESTDLR